MAIVGWGLGVLLFVVFLVAPQGAAFPYRVNDGFGGEFCEDSQVWCNGQSLGFASFSGQLYFFLEVQEYLLKDITAQWIILLVLKLVVSLFFGSLFLIMVGKCMEELQSAALPMEIMSNILNKWAVEKSVTINELSAWILARRSLLYNECAMILKMHEVVVFGFAFTMVVLVAVQVFLVFFFGQAPSAAIIVGVGLTAFGGLSCIQAAMACYMAQQRHQTLLRSLKEALISAGFPKEDNRIMSIDTSLNVLMDQDYQTKLALLPLNPVVVKGLIGYLVSGGVAVFARYSGDSG